MAHVVWSAGIDSVSGALSKPSKSGQHSCNKVLLGTHRVAPTTSNQCNRVYIRKKVKRSTKPTTDEIRVRAMFSAVSRAANTRMQNIATLADDMAAFKLQKDQPGGKTTFKSYIWALEKAVYEQQNG